MFSSMFKKVNKSNRRLVQPEQAEEANNTQRFCLRIVALAVTGSVVCALVVWGGIKLEDPHTLPITRVEIQGDFYYVEKQQIQQMLNEQKVAGFLNVDVDAIRNRLRDIPWVNSATVRRVWPDTLQVKVVEQRPVARWGAGGLVNGEGQLFFPLPETYPANLPELQGPVDSQAVVATRYKEMKKELEPLALKINRIVLDERRSWKIELNSGVTLLLGRVNNNARLTRFARLYPVALAARAVEIEQVDLRYTNGFSVRWKT